MLQRTSYFKNWAIYLSRRRLILAKKDKTAPSSISATALHSFIFEGFSPCMQTWAEKKFLGSNRRNCDPTLFFSEGNEKNSFAFLCLADICNEGRANIAHLIENGILLLFLRKLYKKTVNVVKGEGICENLRFATSKMWPKTPLCFC